MRHTGAKLLLELAAQSILVVSSLLDERAENGLSVLAVSVFADDERYLIVRGIFSPPHRLREASGLLRKEFSPDRPLKNPPVFRRSIESQTLI